MNTLWLNHVESDYGSSFAFSGFCSVIGADKVFDYPNKKTYHDGIDEGYSVPEHNIHGNGYTAPLPWQTGVSSQTDDWNDNLVSDLLRQGFFDLVFIESQRPYCRRSWSVLGDAIKAAGIPVILHNGEDHPSIGEDFAREVEPDLWLVRERTKDLPFTERQGKTLILPFPFSAPDCLVTDAPARPVTFDHDVSCLLGMSHPYRAEVVRALRESNLPGVYVATSDPPQEAVNSLPQHPLMGWQEYIEVLRRSRFGVSVRGFGWDTCRYWEVAAVTGLIADEVDIHIPFPFANGVNALIYGDHFPVTQFAYNLSELGANYEEIAQNGIQHAHRYHTNSARVRWMLEHLEVKP